MEAFGSVEECAVPANRLGQLLVEARLRQGTDLEILAQRSAFTVGELRDLEAGHRLLTNDLVAEITSIYEVDCGPIVPQRNRLIIDLNDNKLSAETRAIPLESSDRDHILDRYLALVYLLRNTDPGTKVTLRDEDLDILAASLAERRELVEAQLLRAMDPTNTQVGSLFGFLRRHLWVPAAGALVGATSIGALILVASPSSGEEISAEEVRTEAVNNQTVRSANSVVAVPGTVVTPDATATTQTTSTVNRPESGPTSPRAQALGAEAEALLPFDWEEILPDWEINYEGTNTAYRGLTYPYEASIDIFIRDTDTPESIAPILAHEIGHALDVTYLSGSDRETWLEVRGIEQAPWWADAFASDFQSGAGDFAEAFAAWATGDSSSSQLAGDPTSEEIAVLLGLLEGVLPPA